MDPNVIVFLEAAEIEVKNNPTGDEKPAAPTGQQEDP